MGQSESQAFDTSQIHFIAKRLEQLDRAQIKAFLDTYSQEDKQKVIYYWRRILKNQTFDQQMQATSDVVRQIFCCSQQKDCLADIKLQQIQIMASLMQKSDQNESLLYILNQLYVKRQIKQLVKSERIFKTLVFKFQHIQNEQTRYMVSLMLVQLMKDNHYLIKYANQPYYFMEYLLHLINQQTEQKQVVFWFQNVKSLYILPEADQNLFYQNDFRILVDILIRNAQNFKQQKQLISYMQTYLVLSISPFLVYGHQYYKLDQLIMVLQDINQRSASIEGYYQQLQQLSKQKK